MNTFVDIRTQMCYCTAIPINHECTGEQRRQIHFPTDRQTEYHGFVTFFHPRENNHTGGRVMGVNLGRKELADFASDFTMNGGEVAVTRVITVAVHGVEDE